MAVKRAFYTSVEIEKAFNENEIVPDSLSSAPKKIVNVSADEVNKVYYDKSFYKEN